MISFLASWFCLQLSDRDAAVSLHLYVENIFQVLHITSQDPNRLQDPSRSEGLMRAAMGVIG
jgi:hypothetical protein